MVNARNLSGGIVNERMSDTAVCSVAHIDHVALAVRDIQAALTLFQDLFGVSKVETTDLPDQGVRATLVPIGQTRLELLQPLAPGTPVGRFIENRGEGLHHLAFNVSDLSGKLKSLELAGVRLVDHEPREGLSGKIAFIHPRSVFGVLTELVESESHGQ